MKSKARIPHVLFAIALIAWGAQHFLLGEFVAGRPPAWLTLPGKEAIAYASGLILIISGVCIIVKRYAAFTVTFAGIMILFWSGMQNIFLVVTKLDYGGGFTNMNKSLSIGFGCLFVANTFLRLHDSVSLDEKLVEWTTRARPIATFFLGFFLFASGIQHFLFVDFVKFLVPAFIPGALFWTYFAGVALILGGLSIMTGIFRKWALLLSGGMIFAWVFLLHLPRALGPAGNANEWTAVFEATAISALLFLMYLEVGDSNPKKI